MNRWEGRARGARLVETGRCACELGRRRAAAAGAATSATVAAPAAADRQSGNDARGTHLHKGYVVPILKTVADIVKAGHNGRANRIIDRGDHG